MMRVLIVEDYRDAADMLARFVRISGHEPFVATDGFRAVELARKNPMDLVLMDVHMPGMNGYDTTRRFRQDLGFSHPIYALTAFAPDHAREQEAGMDGHYLKPLDFSALRSLLNS